MYYTFEDEDDEWAWFMEEAREALAAAGQAARKLAARHCAATLRST